MSIIRQRSKNLIFSAFLGFLIGISVVAGGAYVFKNQLMAKWPQKEAVLEEVVTLVPTIVAARPIAKGTVLDADDITIIMVDEAVKVRDHFTDPSELIGKETAMDVDRLLPMTTPMLVDESMVDDHSRLFEVSFIELPYRLELGDVVDVRIAFPTGQEFVVLSHKTVMGFERRRENIHEGLLNLALREEEALRLSSAMVDSYLAEGARVYLAKYVNPEHQSAAIVNYPVNQHVIELIKGNPNILEAAVPTDDLTLRSALDLALSELVDEDSPKDTLVDMTTPDLNADAARVEGAPAENNTENEAEKVEETTQSSGIGF